MVLDDHQSLARKVQDLKRDRDVAKGALSLLMKRLKTEFGCNSIKEARRLLRKLELQECRMMAEYTKARKDFDKKWKGKI